MSGRGRVVVAMSGGVDSSVSAALLVDQGYDVVGVAMRLWEDAESESGCCSLDDFLDARLVAEKLDIPFYVMDFREEFRATVVANFVREYRQGRTPNPCAATTRSSSRRSGTAPASSAPSGSPPDTTRGAATARRGRSFGAASIPTRISRTSCSRWAARRWRAPFFRSAT